VCARCDFLIVYVTSKSELYASPVNLDIDISVSIPNIGHWPPPQPFRFLLSLFLARIGCDMNSRWRKRAAKGRRRLSVVYLGWDFRSREREKEVKGSIFRFKRQCRISIDIAERSGRERGGERERWTASDRR
jgi:hypothetical protein